MDKRRINECMNCGETREIAAHGLCFACYRAEQRSKERAERQVDRHNPAIRREHKKLFRAHAAIMGGLSDLNVSKNDIFEVKAILEPYLAAIQEYLNAVNVNTPTASEQFTEPQDVNREQESDVHIHAENNTPVNSERHGESSQFTTESQEQTQVPDDVNGEHADVRGHSGIVVGALVAFSHPKHGGLYHGKVTRIDDDIANVQCGRGHPFRLKVAELKKAVQ